MTPWVQFSWVFELVNIKLTHCKLRNRTDIESETPSPGTAKYVKNFEIQLILNHRCLAQGLPNVMNFEIQLILNHRRLAPRLPNVEFSISTHYRWSVHHCVCYLSYDPSVPLACIINISGVTQRPIFFELVSSIGICLLKLCVWPGSRCQCACSPSRFVAYPAQIFHICFPTFHANNLKIDLCYVFFYFVINEISSIIMEA